MGRQVAKAYNDVGKRVINISRHECDYASDNFLADITNEAAVRLVIEKILAIDEPIEALVNCAGVMSLEPLGKITGDEVDRTFGVNVRGAILIVSGLSSRLKQNGSDIINVASTVGLKAYPNQAAYGASKWAMRGFSQNLQVELKDTNRVVSFCVGGFKSDIAKKITGMDLPDPENWMDPSNIAGFMKQILDLPKNMEVSEIILNRKPGK